MASMAKIQIDHLTIAPARWPYPTLIDSIVALTTFSRISAITTATTNIKTATRTFGKYAKTLFKNPANATRPKISTAAIKKTITKTHLTTAPTNSAASTLNSAFAKASFHTPFSKTWLNLAFFRMLAVNLPTATETSQPIKKTTTAPIKAGMKFKNPCQSLIKESIVTEYQFV